MITSLFWIRWKKLNQIAHRWFVLHKMCINLFGEKKTDDLLEGIVYKGLHASKYTRKDLILNYSLSMPLYLSLLYQCKKCMAQNKELYFLISITCIGIALHAIISFILLSRKCEDPFSNRGQ